MLLLADLRGIHSFRGDKEMVFPVSMKGVYLRVENSVLQIKGRPLCLDRVTWPVNPSGR